MFKWSDDDEKKKYVESVLQRVVFYKVFKTENFSYENSVKIW